MGPKLPHTLTSENNCLPAARCIQATPFGKIDEPVVCAIARSCLDPKNQPVACLAVQHGSGGAFGGDGIMNPRRFTTVAPAFCGSLVLAGVIAGWLAGFGSAGTEDTGAVPIENGAASLTANARLADEPQAIAMANAADADASDAFGLDFNFMKAVARIESGFDPKQHTGSYIGLFQLSKYEFNKFGSGQILDSRDNAIAAAYKFITEGILFEWVTQKKPTLSDLYLIHQQGWEGAAEHISQPDRIAWKSMCATSEGREKGERWCKRAIWRNTLPAIKQAWKSVDKLTSEAFVGMWRTRVAEFYSKYMATAAAAERANQ